MPRTDAGYAVLVDWLDVDELSARSAEAAAALAQGRLAAARAAAEAALVVARGDVVPDEDGEWVRGERASADRAVAIAGRVAAEAALVAGDAEGAVRAATAALARDPFDEPCLRTLMRAHRDAGRPASALAAYAALRERLAEELGVSPGADTEAVHDEVLLAGTEPAPASTPVPEASSTLVGRRAELEVLTRSYAEVAEGGTRMVVLIGEPGIGKSTLLAEVGRLATPGALVVGSRCDPLGRDLPLQPIVDAVSDACAAAGFGPAPDDHHARAGAATVVLDADEGRARLFDALLADLRRAAGGRRVVLLLDDLHHAAPSTLAWLAFAARRAERLLVVAAARPPGPEVLDAARLEVGPLPPGDAALVAGPDAPEVLGRAAGNPLFLVALGRSDGPLPATVRDAVATQVAGLGDAAPTIATAACLGDVLDLDLVADIVGRPAIDVLADLERAADAGVLVEDGAGFAFRHAIVREAIEAGIGAARRAFVHREAARALDARPRRDALAVAVHARLGGAVEPAIAAYVEAAAAAALRFDVTAARGYLDEAIALGPSAPALVARARLRMATVDHDGAAEDAAAAVAAGGGATALEVVAWVAHYQRRYDQARAAADEVVARAGDDPAVRASGLAVAGRVRHGRGDLRGATDRLAMPTGAPPSMQGVVDVWLAHARVHEGRPTEALALADRALLDPLGLAHPWAALHGRFARVMALGQVGRLGDAHAACDDLDAAIAVSGEVGRRFVPFAANVRGWVLRSGGRFEEALEANRRAADAAGSAAGTEPASDATAEGFWVAHLDEVDGHLLVGDLEAAAAGLDRCAAIDGWDGSMAWHQRQRLGILRARWALATGDEAAACGAAQLVLDDAQLRGTERYRLLAAAWLAAAGGDGDLQRIDAVVTGLATCAAPEGWRLVAALGERFDVASWRTEADRRAAGLVATAGPLAPDLRRAVAATR